MNAVPVAAVARRELAETTTDWRLLIPLMVLTFVVPLLIFVAVLVLVQTIGDAPQIASSVPLALLLCGFLPAGFSLVNASESFVGEKERNTLEALLATPMTDHELYVGKLLATLLPPLGSALLAMLTFAGLLALRAPHTAAHLTLGVFSVIVVSVACKALVLVSGALVISIHATTVRAANLLASFLLVPMAIVVELEALLISADYTPFLWTIAAVLGVVALLMIRRGVTTFNRETILARDHARFDGRRLRRSFKRFLWEYQPAGVPLDHYQGTFSLHRFYRYELLMLLRDYRVPLAITAVAMTGGLVTGAAMFGKIHFTWLAGAITLLDPAGREAAREQFLAYIRLAVVANVLSTFTFGLVAMVMLPLSAAQIGYTAMWQLTQGIGMGPVMLLYLIPYMLLGLPALVLTGALALRLGIAVIYTPRGFSVAQNIIWSIANFIKVFLLVLLPLFLLAALVEAWASPLLAHILSGS